MIDKTKISGEGIEVSPSLKDFIRLTKENNLIVFSYKFYSDWLSPLSIYYGLMKKIKGESFLLESVEGEEKICRFSFMGFKPEYVFKSKGREIRVEDRTTRNFTTDKDPLYELKKIMRGFKVAPRENLRFFGGFVGYMGYDMVRFYESIGKDLPDSLDTYDSYFILPKFLIIFDHIQRQIEILSFVNIENSRDLKSIYLKEKNTIYDIFRKIIVSNSLPHLSFSSSGNLKVEAEFKKKDFLNSVKKAKEHINKGDIIQAVLSQRFSVDFRGDPFMAYRYLRILNPSPYMFYLNFKDVKLCGASPEMLLRCEHGELITHPIAGTRKRGKDDNEDKKLEISLLDDPKERAEHIMLVDLARNDLGRVAKKASVKIPRFMTVERFSHVMHIVSEVRADLKDNEDIFSSLISCFPAGTVSGAPKVRAMQIINDLEPHKRGIYAGAVGYFSFTKSLDTCIIIRTIVFKNNKAFVQAGAGIVSDSQPLREYKETVNKARAQIIALELAS